MRRKTIAVLGVALGIGLTVSACDVKLRINRERDSLSYDVTDKVAALVVRTGAGDVTVNESDRTGIQVAETRDWSGAKPQNGHRVDGDTLILEYDCRNCGIDYRIDVPRGVEVKIDSGAGDITLRSLTGPVRLSTGAGDVDANGLAGKRVSVDTGSGDVKLKFASAPDEVSTETGAGSATLWVPQGSYNVTAETAVGSRRIDVSRDSSASRSISVKTGVGDIKVLKL
ncbi:DUF4097 family beta strand repeat-containing protein [Microtetraspora sp. NBRC 16547]|uniref:DUF4097 family beta strand repeat-containing protein n=1 Tax=Microtetraspora sp. NBRC 16547 TaxID=3030993 RepID=UPI0024A2903F|nr:DUF4097 family beta strand repeat-containing protein [Microtetraspora sp. NBRC 16547]GLW97930.1 hypothetical protein Misp02_20170 [Microtetraspora sp. NBRC 16547]